MSDRIRRSYKHVRNLAGQEHKHLRKQGKALKSGLFRTATKARKIAIIAGDDIERKVKQVGRGFKLFGAQTSEGAVKVSKLFERKVYQPFMGAMPNRLKKTIAAMGLGYTVGALVAAGLILGGVVAGGPFTLIPIVAIGVGFMVLGFALDIGADVEKQQALIKALNLKDPQGRSLGERTAAHIKNPTLSKIAATGIDGFLKGAHNFVVSPLRLAHRYVYEPVMSRLPSRLSNAVEYANYGYSGGATVGGGAKLFGGGLEGIPIIVGTVSGFVFGFTIDVKNELTARGLLPEKIEIIDPPEQPALSERQASVVINSPLKQAINVVGKKFSAFWGGTKKFGGEGVSLIKRFAAKHQKTLTAIGIGVTIGALAGAAIALVIGGGPFTIIAAMVIGGVVFLVFGMMLDIARNAEERKEIELVDLRTTIAVKKKDAEDNIEAIPEEIQEQLGWVQS